MSLEERDQATVVTHALAQQTLTELRRVETDPTEFRDQLIELGRICGMELIDDYFGTAPVEIETPLTETTGVEIAGRDDVMLVSVLRAALPFVEGLVDVFPTARQGVISASRDESAERDEDGLPIAVEYVSLPEPSEDETVIVADPMLATGSTLSAVLTELLTGKTTPESVIVLAAVSAPEGLERLAAEFPEVELVTVAIDEKLNEESFIVPGLGDAGDRAFRTG